MLDDFISLLFPRCCAISGKPLARGEQLISFEYAASLPRYDPYSSNDNLYRKFSGLVNLNYVWAYYKFSKKSGVQKLMHQIKYNNMPELGELSGRWFGEAIHEIKSDIDLVIPVPMHPAKRRKRGYNQADYIAKGVAETLQIEWYPDVMIKAKNTSTQTKKGRKERFDNAEDIYRVKDPAKIVGKRALVIDDVITTGATIGQCAKLLLESGCTNVSVAALAAAE